MFNFIWTLPVKLRGTRNKLKLQNEKFLFTVEFEPSHDTVSSLWVAALTT